MLKTLKRLWESELDKAQQQLTKDSDPGVALASAIRMQDVQKLRDLALKLGGSHKVNKEGDHEIHLVDQAGKIDSKLWDLGFRHSSSHGIPGGINQYHSLPGQKVRALTSYRYDDPHARATIYKLDESELDDAKSKLAKDSSVSVRMTSAAKAYDEGRQDEQLAADPSPIVRGMHKYGKFYSDGKTLPEYEVMMAQHGFEEIGRDHDYPPNTDRILHNIQYHHPDNHKLAGQILVHGDSGATELHVGHLSTEYGWK